MNESNYRLNANKTWKHSILIEIPLRIKLNMLIQKKEENPITNNKLASVRSIKQLARAKRSIYNQKKDKKIT